ncbi:PQQ-binding-like beta-propeller repeat protein [Salinimicrobium terrae]|uniref:outer membrane protein assembly factor BamB family protein n=1 Tax=Salinimicrobium terrae TaxID=470866 RepID=UPI0004007D2E|nr:PQQ-binding-like beta-propeller repeat protein [Salinimicrobium terrae]
MKKINIIFSFMFLISLQALAQKDPEVLSNSKEVGKNLLTMQPVRANEYTFQDRIHDFQVDTVNDRITIQLRGLSKNGKWLDNRGRVVRYDTEGKRVLWSKKIIYQTEHLEQTGGVTLHSTGRKSYSLDNATGKELWEIKNFLLFADAVDKIGIGYKIQPLKAKENTLEGIDLTNGQPIWQREVSREYGWNEVFYLNDSTLLISASGLHAVNIFDGTGWHYKTVTGKKDYTAAAVGTGLGIAAGLLTGTYAVSTGHNLVRDVVSNVLVDSANIYFASRKELVRLNKKGEVLWQKGLPDDMTSKSMIFRSGDDLVMVNRGFASMGYRQLDFGTPFIAAFDIHSGNQKYLKNVGTGKKDIIKAVDLKDGELSLVFNDQVSKFSVEDGQLIGNKKFDTEVYGELNYFIGEQVFVEKDNSYQSLLNIDPSKHYLYTGTGRILILDSNLELVDEIKTETEDIYVNYLNREDKRFLAKENRTFVIDTNGKTIAEFSASGNSIFLNGKLYDAQENGFLEIDLDNIINNSL